MNKRDTIIIAALLNAATLAVLFMMAVNKEDDAIIDPSQISTQVIASAPQQVQEVTSWAVEDSKMYSTDEVDDLLREFDALAAETISQETSNPSKEQVVSGQSKAVITQDQKETSSLAFALPDVPGDEHNFSHIVDITVKKGDSLDKIAKANGTNVSDIKRINKLKTERLAIGQILKVPVVSAKTQDTEIKKEVVIAAKSSLLDSNQEPVYYTIKSGDNPWKIARQMRIKMDDLLKLNNLNEEKARNLKIGDKIRIK